MKKNSATNSAFIYTRNALAVLLCVSSVSLGMFSFAGAAAGKNRTMTKQSGIVGGTSFVSPNAPVPTGATLSRANPTVAYDEPAGMQTPNLTGLATGTPVCTVPTSCSTFDLTIDPSIGTVAPGYDPTQFQIHLTWSWSVATVDYDIFMETAAGTVFAVNNSTADPSVIILPSNTPAGLYHIVVVLSTGAPIGFHGSAVLEPKPPVTGLCGPPANCTPPRYQNYSAGVGQADNAGEPSIGVDWTPNVAALKHDKVNTGGVAFFTSGANEWRVNFDDCSSPAVNLWENVSAPFDQQFVLSDPIGFVDHYSSNPLGLAYPPPQTPGRVFAIDLIGGQGDSLGAYSDQDGNPSSWLPGGTGGPGAGPDHQTLGGGPYFGTPPATATYPAIGTKNAIYYCSQNIVAEAQCSRSDNGGVAGSFGPSVPIFTPSQCTGGIHGHVKVAPDGTVYVPNSSCGTTGNDGVAVSINNGVTWTENNVPVSTGTQDPSVGIGQNNVGKPSGNLAGTNTIYLGWTSGDGHAHVAHSGDRGATYTGDTDVGAPFGVTHAVFPVVVAGDDNRAAFGFLGTGDGIPTTGTCDPYGATLNCKNIWHLYIATTYDGGANWITVDATPNDPVQQGTICLQGTTCAGGRNLLDFNGFDIDAEGRGLVGYADGCVNCGNTFTAQSGSDHGTVTRQSGGRRLFAFFDPVEPAVPAAPQMLSAITQPSGAALISWLEPDNGGSPITGYKVYRGTTSGGETFLADVSGVSNTKYLDPAPPTGNVFYYATAINAQGESTHCGEVSLGGGGGGETQCQLPGLTILTDQAGDIITPVGQTTNPGWDLRKLSIAEPYAFAPDKLVFTLKVESFPGGVPPANTRWPIQFRFAGDPATVGRWVDMSTYPADLAGAPPGTVAVFKYGTFNPTGGTGGTYGAPNTRVGFADVGSNFNPDGTITIVVSRSKIGNPGVGGALVGFLVRVRFGADAASVTPDNMPDSLATNTGIYTVVGNDPFCRPNTAPVAVLTANPLSGAPPLLVHFDGSGSFDPDTAPPPDTIANYHFDFGDGSPAVDQSTPLVDHTYNNPGNYPARLTVTDSRGKQSTNVAQVIITVAGTPPPLSSVVSRKTHGSITPPFDVPLQKDSTTQPRGVECRTGGANGDHTIVFTFVNNLVSVDSASVVSGPGSVVTATTGIGPNPNQYTVNLTGVTNAQYVTVALNNAKDTAGNIGVVATALGALAGDTTADGFVNSGDIAQTKSQSGQVVSGTNFREDVTIDGNLNSGDISLVKSKSGTALPTLP